MAVPVNLDEYQLHLFSSLEEMQERRLAQRTIDRLLRLRELYTSWRNFPAMSTKEVVQRDMQHHGVNQREAYDDVKIIKILMGNLEQESKEWQRLVFNRRSEEIYNEARRVKDYKTAEKANADYAKYNRLNDPDDIKIDPSAITPVRIEPTTDPTVIGINPPKNWRRKMEKLKAKWRTEAQDTDFIEITDEDAAGDEEGIS